MEWRRPLGRLGDACLNAVLPPRCLACGEAVLMHGTACPDCFAGLTLLQDPQCECCGVPFQHEGQGVEEAAVLQCGRCLERPPVYEQARAAFLYDAGSKRLLLPLKYGDRTDLAVPIARQMVRAGRALLPRSDVLIPVPLHRGRLIRRRYNQAALLTREISRLSGRPWDSASLRRVRGTSSLGRLTAFERAQELDNAFRVTADGAARLAGRRVLLIDDVLTSGATVSACAAALLMAGVAAVDVLAAARVPDPRLTEAG